MASAKKVGAAALDGRFQLGAPLGRGHDGETYAAVELGTGRSVAVKLLRPGDAAAEARLVREELGTPRT